MLMKNPKKLVDCSIVTLTAFLGAPILFFGFDSVTLMSLTLFVLFPLVCLICGILCGRENGLHLHYPILVALLFLPTIFLFYDSSVWPFWVTYIMIAFIGLPSATSSSVGIPIPAKADCAKLSILKKEEDASDASSLFCCRKRQSCSF